jgi:hypothetical protein
VVTEKQRNKEKVDCGYKAVLVESAQLREAQAVKAVLCSHGLGTETVGKIHFGGIDGGII